MTGVVSDGGAGQFPPVTSTKVVQEGYLQGKNPSR